MAHGVFELAVVILVATGLGIMAKLLRQPIILAYIVTGVVIGSLGALDVVNQEIFAVFSNLGIMFLLFLVGLEINYTSLRLVGKTSAIVGIGQVIFTSIFGYLIATVLGFSLLPALYIAVALTFSSTVIVVKLLTDRNDLNSLHGRISIGFLLVQDLVAALILMLLAGFDAPGNGTIFSALLMAGKGIALFAIMLWLGRAVLPRLFSHIARSQELLFLTSLAWLFLVTAGAYQIGFSIEIAGFLAGLALANSSEHFEIAGKIRSLRDFFILMFFVVLGLSVVRADIGAIAGPVAAFSLFVLIGNPFIVLVIMGLLGHKRRTSFLAGVTVAQISEFSLILAAMGLKLGHIAEDVVVLITSVGVITIGVSAYLITHAEAIFRVIQKPLRIFERRNIRELQHKEESYDKPVILIGCHRTGESIAMSIQKKDVLIVDFDPEVIKKMEDRGYACLFGDIRDLEIFEKAGILTASLVISTSPDFEDNMFLLASLHSGKAGRRPKAITRAETEQEAQFLYEAGADYVLLPHFTSGQYLGKTIAIDSDMKILRRLKEHDLGIMHKMARS